MALDFSIEPFFDDYSEDKKFHRILFRPGYAVQARELTQLQTILQEQIRRHGDHIFKEGSMVIPGQISYDLNLSYAKLEFDANTNPVDVLTGLVGKEVKNSNNLIAKVIAYTLPEGTESAAIYLKYQNSVQDLAGNNVSTYTPLDSLTPVDGSSGLDVTVADVASPIGKACSATIQRGVYYIKKNFVLVEEQTIILDKFTNTPSYRVGLKLTEDIVYPEDDESLLDNALGSPNYSAPGAARYYMTLDLTKLSLTDVADENYIDLLRLQDGRVIFKIDRSQYAELDKTLARRTYDESGDYALSPFGVQVKEFRNNLRGDWAPSEKFIQGDLIKVSSGGTGFWYFVAVDAGISGTNRPNFQKTTDYLIDGGVKWEYIPYPNFNGGVNTFTAGDSAYAEFTLNDHTRMNGMLSLGVEAGKAYVRGYEIEKLSTEFLPTMKARELPAGSDALRQYLGLPADTVLAATNDAISPQKTAGQIDMSMGSYIIMSNVAYAPDIVSLSEVNLHSVNLAGTPNTSTIIGKARVRAMELHNVSGEYKVFLFDIKMNAGKAFKDVKSIWTSANKFQANCVQTNGSTILQGNSNGSLIYELPDYAINDIVETTYSVVASFTANASGYVAANLAATPPSQEVLATLSLNAPNGSGYTFESANAFGNYIVISNATGAIISATPVIAPTGTSLTISLSANGSYTVLATMKRSDWSTAFATRNVMDGHMRIKDALSSVVLPTIELSHSYVTRIVSIKMAASDQFGAASPVYATDISNRYTFNNGHEVGKIGISSISLIDGAIPPDGPISIDYEYLAVSGGAGDFLAVNSYTHSGSSMRYDEIGNVGNYSLRDCIDFRPYVVGAAYQTRYFPKFGTTASFKYTNYLPRIDNIALSSTGQFVVSQGVHADTPVEPNTPANSMKLAQISIEPYTFKREDSLGAIVQRYENKRYTMRDIGKLERRIQDLEYYTSLTLSELDTKSMRIVDSNGFERYQNGFLVDSFDGQGIGNTSSDDWNASIDSTKKELRPFFSQKQVSLLENVAAETRNYKVSGDLVTLPFTEKELIVQAKASKTENVNPYALYSWKGIVGINPWSDTWFSTHYRPDIILNDEGQYNAVVQKAEADGILGTVWNNWQVAFSSVKSKTSRLEKLDQWSQADTEIVNKNSAGVGNGPFWRARSSFTAEERRLIGATDDLWTGQDWQVAGSRVLTIETSAVETTSTRTGTRSFVVDKVDSRVLEDRVVDTQIVPYIRPRAVLFTGYGFKPSTNMYAFFDNILVNDYIVPATRIEVTKIISSGSTYYPHTFDVDRNAGSAVSNPERTVPYSDGVYIAGTVSVTNGSNQVTGLGTAFNQHLAAGDIVNFGGNLKYEVASIQSNSTLTLKTAYSGTSDSGISVKVAGAKYTTDEVEVAFNHGEVIKEVGGNGNTAIVVGQEVYEGRYYLYVLNIKGTGVFSTSGYLEGEYADANGVKPRVKFVANSKTEFTTLTTTLTGQLCGIFRIPASPILKFRTGTRELRFSDNANTNTAVRAAAESTSGGAFYEAKGLIEIMQRTIVATRTANIVSEQTSDQNTILTTNDRLTRDTGWYDPLAQTFMVQQTGGAFLTSVDLYFASADPKIPVRIEIREVVNGYPGSVKLPFSVVEKKASDVKVDPTTGSLATTFNFPSPVFVQNGTEYALTVLSDSNAYTLWISQTDTVDVQTGVRISSQPYNGVLFKSQNASTWTPDQTQDMKFVIRRAEFSTSPVSIELIPPKLGYTSLGFNPFNFVEGSSRCRVEHKNHGMVTGEKVVFKQRQVNDSINGIPADVMYASTGHTIVSAELDAYVVDFQVNSTATGRAGGAYIAASENFEFQTMSAEIAEVVPPGTSISYTANVVNHSSVASQHSIIPKENTTLDETKVYPSTINFDGNALSITATLNPSSATRSISPVIDLGRMALTMISNKIDSPALDINDNELDLFPITNVGTPTEIGAGKPLDLIDINNDSVLNTLVVNNVAQPILFNNMNNNLQPGHVIRVTYSGITDAVRNMIIVDKAQVTNYDLNGDPESIDLQFTLEGFDGEILEETTDNNAVIVWLSHYRHDYASSGSSTHSKYVTKKINFSRPSEMLKIMFSAIIPNDADVEIYYKTGLGVSGDYMASRYYKVIPSSSYKKSETEFTDIVADVEGLEQFDSVIVKLVMKSINKAKVPRIKDFRVIAVAA